MPPLTDRPHDAATADALDGAARAAEGRITVRHDDALTLICIDRPAKRNGFTPEMADALARAYTDYEHDDTSRCAVVHAAGAHFTGGLDLPRWAERMQRGEGTYAPGTIDPCDLREPRRTKPVVYAVQGVCYTLGIELMLAADVVVAADDSRFSQLEVKRGIMATGGGAFRIAERAGTGNAMLVLLTGDEFDAATAFRFGLVQQVVPAGTQFDAAVAIARRIAAAAPLAVRATIQSARLAREQGPLAAIARYRDVQQRLAASEDAREGVAAFVERRAARFTGR